MKTAEYWSDLRRCIQRIIQAARPINLYLSQCGHPTFMPGVGCSLVGTYTTQVTLQQLIDDIDEADRERRER
jgi:hypothetical protein